MKEGTYMTTERPHPELNRTPTDGPLLPADWLSAVKAVIRLAGKKDRPMLNYLEVEYHEDVTFLVATNGWSLMVAEMPPLEGASGRAHLTGESVKLWLGSKGLSPALLVHDNDAGFPDIRSVMPTGRLSHDGQDLGLSVRLLHEILTAIKGVRPNGKAWHPLAWQMEVSAGGHLDTVYMRTCGHFNPKSRDDTSFLIHALLMPMRLE